MGSTLLISVGCAVLFYRAADYERMSPLAWSVSSFGLTGILSLRGAGTMALLLAQAALFALMWWLNVRRRERLRLP